ncbi:MAG: hypothetical protein HYY18_06455 [Planctomycetes bacterium]|nr:hypothetical protein [Planctomycetota bacterium]
MRQIRDKLSKEAVKACKEGRFEEYTRLEFEAALRDFPTFKVYRGRPRKLKHPLPSKSGVSARAPRKVSAASKGRRKMRGR